MPKHEASSGLAISAGNANDTEPLRRVTIFDAGYDRLGVMIGKYGVVVKGELF